MPHPEREHSLQIEVARLRKEADDAHTRERSLRTDLAAARRECEGLRKALNACLDSFQLAHAHKKLSTAADGGIVCACDLARAALAAPMDGEEGKR